MPTTRQIRHATVAATSLSAAAAWGIVTHVAGVHLTVRFPHSATTTVGLGTICAAGAVAALLGWALLATLERKAAHPRRLWVMTAAVFVFASLGLPIAFATTASALVGLVTIHLTVALFAVAGFAWASPRAQLMPARSDVVTSLGRPLA